MQHQFEGKAQGLSIIVAFCRYDIYVCDRRASIDRGTEDKDTLVYAIEIPVLLSQLTKS